MRIIGIMLVRNEDLFVRQAALNALDFCDELLAVDNMSDDATGEILRGLEKESGGRLKYHRADHPGVSHDLIAPYAGSNTWILGVDGDEIYDPEGLSRLRRRLEGGEFDKDWVVFGNVFNLITLEHDKSRASGHLAPPCRSMTKLYNFSAIDAWRGPCQERLHGGRISFLPGFGEHQRRDLYKDTEWTDTDFRCLHMCFFHRSSKEFEGASPRRNIMDRRAWSLRKVIKETWRIARGLPLSNWKLERYARGPLVTHQVNNFFRQS
jgi:glycosyltransferase involved in cell wall biosynthesis